MNSVGIRTDKVAIHFIYEGEKGRGGKFSDRYKFEGGFGGGLRLGVCSGMPEPLFSLPKVSWA